MCSFCDRLQRSSFMICSLFCMLRYLKKKKVYANLDSSISIWIEEIFVGFAFCSDERHFLSLWVFRMYVTVELWNSNAFEAWNFPYGIDVDHFYLTTLPFFLPDGPPHLDTGSPQEGLITVLTSRPEIGSENLNSERVFPSVWNKTRQARLGDTASSIADHPNRASVTVKGVSHDLFIGGRSCLCLKKQTKIK